MIQTFIDNDGKEVVPFGSAAITVKNGIWTFNGKEVRKANFALQSFVARFIVGCRLAYRVETPRELTPSNSEIATKKTHWKHGHLKQFNHRFKKVEERNLPQPIDILPVFVKKDLEAEEIHEKNCQTIAPLFIPGQFFLIFAKQNLIIYGSTTRKLSI